jgi:glycosyltransferase involved in cell wall biosynthesis
LTKTDLGIPETAVLAAYVGRLAPEKNLFTLLEQVAAARDIVPNLHVTLGGRGDLESDLRSYTEQLNIAPYVHFWGGITYAEVPNYLAAADFFVTASMTEVHPLTIIEAMASGLPVAAPVAPGISDTVVSGETGFLASDPNTGLAAAIVGLALDEERRQMMGHNAQIASERYNIKDTVQRTLVLYEKLQGMRPDLSRKKRHGRWLRQEEKWLPLLDQLTSLIRGDKVGTTPLSLRRFSSIDEDVDDRHQTEDRSDS